MSEKHTCDPRLVAWSGISIRAPESWEVAELGKGYLRMEKGASHRVEFRWEGARGRFDPEKQLKKLGRAFRKVRFERADATHCPAGAMGKELQDRLSARGLHCTPFVWNLREGQAQRHEDRTGQGMMLYSPQQEIALICQTNAPGQGAQMIDSLQLHGADGGTPYNVFGLWATAPAGYRLDNFSFRPGHFRIIFRSTERGLLVNEKRTPATRLSLDRIGPASVALKEQGLADWTEGLLKELHLSRKLRTSEAEGAVRWLRRARRGRRPACMVSAQLHPDTNKILCVSAHGRRLPEPDVFDQLEVSYGTL